MRWRWVVAKKIARRLVSPPPLVPFSGQRLTLTAPRIDSTLFADFGQFQPEILRIMDGG